MEIQHEESILQQTITDPKVIIFIEIIEYILVNVKDVLENAEHNPEINDIVQEICRLISLITPYLSNLIDIPDQTLQDILDKIITVGNINSVRPIIKIIILKMLSFCESLECYVKDLCNDYPTWIENHTSTDHIRDKHMKIVAMLIRLKDNLINIGNSSNSEFSILYAVFTFIEMVEKTSCAGVEPPAELFRSTMHKYPEIHQFVELMLKFIALFVG